MMLKLPFLYFAWHYTTALKNLWQTVTNYLWFVWHFFSIPILLKTLVAPWRRLREHTPGHAFEDLIANAALRMVGVVMRSSTVLLGCVALTIAVVLAVVSYIVWLIIPFLIVGLFIFGVISLTL